MADDCGCGFLQTTDETGSACQQYLTELTAKIMEAAMNGQAYDISCGAIEDKCCALNVGILIAILFGILAVVCGGVACCFCAKCCCFKPKDAPMAAGAPYQPVGQPAQPYQAPAPEVNQAM